MRRTAVFLAMLPLLGTTALAAGRVVETDFYSAALDMTMPVQILLPEGYDPGGTSRYPVIYVLHGSGGTHQSSEFAPAVLDDLIASGVIAPTIVVKPNGNPGPFEGINLWNNSPLNGDIDDYISRDLVEFIDSSSFAPLFSPKRWAPSL